MLSQLSIRNILLIEALDLEFSPALTVVTGETGAGKSIILDALHLILGARGDGTLVRDHQTRGSVTARFEMRDPYKVGILSILESLGIDSEPSVLILRRLQEPDGRTRAFINDIPVSAQALKTIGKSLIDIHSQGDGGSLHDVATHRTWLDAYGGLKPQVKDVEDAWKRLQTAEENYRASEKKGLELEKERLFLEYAIDELERLNPQPGEEDLCAHKRRTLLNGQKTAEALSQAFYSVSGEIPICTSIASALRILERQNAMAPEVITPCITALDSALTSTQDALDQLQQALKTFDPSPETLERIEERLFALRGAARKYNVDSEHLSTLHKRYKDDLESCLNQNQNQNILAEKRALARTAYQIKAQCLSDERKLWAQRLGDAITQELPALKLKNVRCFLSIDTDTTTESAMGYDRVEFWVQTNPGTAPGPLMKVASGGELSRILLAIKVILAKKWALPTLIFDEIDTGMGGAAANAVGMRLENLSQHTQVLAISHAPQVAARAKDHLLVSKDSDRGCTHVQNLTPEERREEIARMLSAERISDEARAAAAHLIERALS